jgi:hypothetical protein
MIMSYDKTINLGICYFVSRSTSLPKPIIFPNFEVFLWQIAEILWSHEILKSWTHITKKSMPLASGSRCYLRKKTILSRPYGNDKITMFIISQGELAKESMASQFYIPKTRANDL